MEPLPRTFDLAPLTPRQLDVWFRGGERQADECEAVLLWAARRRGSLDVAIAEGLDLLRRGSRLEGLGFHLDDYGREVLDLRESATTKLARLGKKLRERPLLREAMRAGRVRLRAAMTVLSVAKGEAERVWVERAATLTVRELERAVRDARNGVAPDDDEDEEWLLLGAHVSADDRALVDAALDLAGRELPGASRMARLEAVAQEFLGWYSKDGDHDAERPLGAAFRPVGGRRDGRDGNEPDETDLELRALLPELPALAAPDVTFDDAMSAKEVDAAVRRLGRLRTSLEEVIGWCAHAIRESGWFKRFGFRTFRPYVEEHLGVPARAVEQRAELEGRLWKSPQLQEARRQGVGYEKLRTLSRLREEEIEPWIGEARKLTCIELRRRLEGEKDRQMRAARKLVVPLPRRIAVLVAAMLACVRERAGRVVSTGKALAVAAAHFVATWEGLRKRRKTRSQRVRERDGGRCLVPGCSHPAGHAHHTQYRSRGGGDELENQGSECAYHHLRVIHGGHLVVVGRAPDGLAWFLADGTPFTGTGE